jgi:hypothetical protein
MNSRGPNDRLVRAPCAPDSRRRSAFARGSAGALGAMSYMKSVLSITALMLIFGACSSDVSTYDESLAARSIVVVTAQLSERGLNCDKYCWHRYTIVQILKGASELDGRNDLLIAARSRPEGPPNGECTLYL